MSLPGPRRLVPRVAPRLDRCLAFLAALSSAGPGCANVAGLSDLEVVDCVEGDCDASTATDTSPKGDGDATFDADTMVDGDSAVADDVTEAGDVPVPTDGVTPDVRDAVTFDTSGCEAEGALLNCGGCGRRCDTTTGTPSCTGGKCSYVCVDGKLDCDQSAFNTNGCETSKTSPFSCGSCDNVCDTSRSNPDPTTPCDGTKCRYASCKPGFLNCDTSGVDKNGCETAISAANCGACGTQCDTTTGTPSCSGAKCSYVCNGTKADCEQSGTNTNGCEADRTNVNNCGTCGQVCTPFNASLASCDGTKCIYSCNKGFTNCEAAPALGGCTCETSTGTPGCCGTGCQTKHVNGLGQDYFDCVAVGTYDSVQAEKAKAAWVATQGGTLNNVTSAQCTTGGQTSQCAVAQYPTACALWCYTAGTPFLGLASVTTTEACQCPTLSTSTWN